MRHVIVSMILAAGPDPSSSSLPGLLQVGNSEAALLQKLNIMPFTYGLKIMHIYDNGSLFDPAVLDLTDADLANKFGVAVRNVAALSLVLGYPTLASLPHSIANAFKTILAVVVQLDGFSFPKADPYKVSGVGVRIHNLILLLEGF